jgi:hypothetical protein
MMPVLFTDKRNGLEDVGIFRTRQLAPKLMNEGFNPKIILIVNSQLVVNRALLDLVQQTLSNELP